MLRPLFALTSVIVVLSATAAAVKAEKPAVTKKDYVTYRVTMQTTVVVPVGPEV